MDQATILESVRVYLRQEEYYPFRILVRTRFKRRSLICNPAKWAKRLAWF
jgi:hypothetical protein